MNAKFSITGTFLDEISHDINHQNWGEKEWEQDFTAMKRTRIDTVIMIRSGYQKWLTYPSEVLISRENCIKPYVDQLEMFLRLSERFGMKFFFGLYDSGKYQANGAYKKETELNRLVMDEAYQKYGSSTAFAGWYFSHEINRNVSGVVEEYATLGNYCKNLSGLPILISPYIDGKKAVMASSAELTKADPISLEVHEQEWDSILSHIEGTIDIVAFQDGHVDYDELPDFMRINKKLCDKYGMECWTNCESFDRDMPIKFLPIKWEKMCLKLEAARKAGLDKAITFEFSHFMSPNSSYPQARHLYNRYMEYITEK